MKNTEKQGEHFCLHFLRGCAILLYTDECISPRAIVAQLDRAFGSDPEGQRFESSRSHQEKPRHIVPGLFFFLCDREDSNSTALRSRVSNQPSGLLLSARFPTGRNVYQQAVLCPENRKKLLRVRSGRIRTATTTTAACEQRLPPVGGRCRIATKRGVQGGVVGAAF